ncbi:hypothetical protein Lrub_0430 [Legionella rubrilucens]|uniref:Solute-binding protein family 3/N-terminal domain-containing protein n=1 Tax=Legionella rubrilucens TaxID=458 RepID=A0A0W0XZ13_9GAMM|nr:hypothetical protein [Legionella rubrilucens]KTD49802.1 hypothetical protein Lrub_0430 [Legionella rubrilucens]
MVKWINSIQTTCLVIALSSCQFPDDPNRTLKAIQETHRLKAGVCSNQATPLEEIELLRQLARDLHAEITWYSSNQEALYRQLQHFKLDIAACAIHQDSPWSEILAFSVPYYKKGSTAYVLALPPGENGWLKEVNEFIHQQREIQHAARH